MVDKYTYALGYDSSSNSHKVLRLIDYPTKFVEFKIYEFSSDSWRILDLLPRDWMIGGWGERGLSLKGNTYWFTYDNNDSFLVCFDFTRETFWSPLPLPFENAYPQDTVSLSSVREDQLVILFQPWDILILEIWISTKIDEPNALSWNNKMFLSADIRQLIPPSAGFFIDEEKKIAVVFDKDTDIQNPTREVAYIIGVDGSFKAADVRECADKHHA
ncbi:F-box protein [Raphanus sativus]|nr:F-box protein [Raphanus sativus]